MTPESTSAEAPLPVAFINNFAGPRFGGGEVHLVNLASGLKNRGHGVTAIVMPASGVAAQLKEHGVRVIEEDVMGGNALAMGRRISDLLGDSNVQIVHGTGFFTNLLARLAGPRLDARVVNAVHCEVRALLTYVDGVGGWMRQTARDWADRSTLSRVDAFIANAYLLTEGLRELGVDEDRIFVAYNGVDPDALRSRAAGLPKASVDAPPIVGTLGRLEPVKGLDVFLDAVPRMLDEHPGARFRIAGQGSLGEYLEERIASQPQLADAVELEGFVDDPVEFLTALDVFCLSSLSEGFNTTVLEAQALGVPVVATAVGGTAEAVIDGVTGELIPPDDSVALANGVNSMLDDPARAATIADAAQLQVAEKFTVACMVDTTVDVYRQILRGA